MNELALFCGAGGGLLASRLLGWRTVCGVEIDPYCREVVLRRQEEGCLEPFPVWDDIRTFRGEEWRGAVDIVTAGFPCQPFSTASRGRKTAPDLFLETARIICEVQPEYVVLENVLASAFPPSTRCALARIGAGDVGAHHRRPRYWLVANADNEGQSTEPLYDEVACLQKAARTDWWDEVPSGVLGVADGVAYRVDRIRAIGNGQVPLVAATAWRALA